jgi:alpha-glucuronidase
VKKNWLLYLLALLFAVQHVSAEDGYRLWLRYEPVSSYRMMGQYRQILGAGYYIAGNSPTLQAARQELRSGLTGMLVRSPAEDIAGSLLIGTVQALKEKLNITITFPSSQKDSSSAFSITTRRTGNRDRILITGYTDVGVLYGVFYFLRLLQTETDIQNINIQQSASIKNRILNHWDNLNRHVERGYAGESLWNWHTLPGYIDQRYIDYARANASIGINGTVLTNVNANAMVLTPDYLIKVKALADVFRPYGIKVYLTARFSAPVEIGKLSTADPLDKNVQQWWQKKVKEIYSYIPDFGGFLVKANSEGQPGPQNYGRTHADGANMLADALAPYGGMVMWRAFVYSSETPEDRFKQAYTDFKPLDGQFRSNVMIQVKNGPIDFQPREPFHPLFGAMPKSQLMMEFQLTQEYLGFSTHLVYLPLLQKEILDTDTYAKGKGSTIAKIIDGELYQQPLTGIAGVANIGSDINWCGHPFAQANWYGFGRLAWDPSAQPAQIADEWIRQTFSNDPLVIAACTQIMLSSYEAVVNYMTPLGLHHIMGYGHHYGPAPWYNKAPRADWNPVYFHKADAYGLGFDRTVKGSNALSQYNPSVAKIWSDSNSCNDKYLLWFHHVSWQHRMQNGNTLWEELCHKYNEGVDTVQAMQKSWNLLQAYIDPQRFWQVAQLLSVQNTEAEWWRDACLLYFQSFSRQPIPARYKQPSHTLEYFESLQFPYAPGNGN